MTPENLQSLIRAARIHVESLDPSRGSRPVQRFFIEWHAPSQEFILSDWSGHLTSTPEISLIAELLKREHSEGPGAIRRLLQIPLTPPRARQEAAHLLALSRNAQKGKERSRKPKPLPPLEDLNLELPS